MILPLRESSWSGTVRQSSKVEPQHNIADLSPRIREFAAQRNWTQFHDPKNLSMAIASEAGELAGILRWIPNHEADAQCEEPKIRERLVREIGDLGILLLLLCDRLGEDFGDAVRAKLEINASNYPVEVSRGRPERDGK